MWLSVHRIQALYVTWHEKTMLMYTKYTSLHYFNYLSFCVCHTCLNCTGFPIVSCTISKSFINTLRLVKKLLTFKVLKSCQILCVYNHCFLMLGHNKVTLQSVHLLYTYVSPMIKVICLLSFHEYYPLIQHHVAVNHDSIDALEISLP